MKWSNDCRLLMHQRDRMAKYKDHRVIKGDFQFAYTHDRRGDDDEIPAYLFRGLRIDVLRRVLDWFGNAKGFRAFTGYRIYIEPDCYPRVGNGVYYHVVELYGRDYNFMSDETLDILLEARLKAECPCVVRRLTMNKFLNP